MISTADVEKLKSQLFETRCQLELRLMETPWSDETDGLIDDLDREIRNVTELMQSLRAIDMDVISQTAERLKEMYVYGVEQERVSERDWFWSRRS